MAAQRKCPEELRERAVKMLFEVQEQDGKGGGAVRGGQAVGSSPGGAALLRQAGGN
jgi:hypothetical protein